MRLAFAFLVLLLVVASAGCVPKPTTIPSTEPSGVVASPDVVAPAAPVATVPDIADESETTSAPDSACSADAAPSFSYGFLALKSELGARMGEPVSCERTSVETGDSLQQTTRGLARYAKASNTPTFSSGIEHWALTSRGVVYWVGRSLEPADDAVVGLGSTQQPSVVPPQITATPVPSDSAVPIINVEPEWLRRGLELLAAYDRRHGTILEKTAESSNIVVFGIPGAWAAYIPKKQTITLDPVLQNESPEALATVLAHEGQHAVDTKLSTKNRAKADPEVMCYTWEISAFSIQAAVWQSLNGDAGKAEPRSALEQELNDILIMAKADSWQLTSRIRERYRDQCV